MGQLVRYKGKIRAFAMLFKIVKKWVFSIVTKCYILNNSWRRMEYIPYKRSLYNKEMKIQEEHHVRFKVCQRKFQTS